VLCRSGEQCGDWISCDRQSRIEHVVVLVLRRERHDVHIGLVESAHHNERNHHEYLLQSGG
jgi:hypothetical protein